MAMAMATREQIGECDDFDEQMIERCGWHISLSWLH